MANALKLREQVDCTEARRGGGDLRRWPTEQVANETRIGGVGGCVCALNAVVHVLTVEELTVEECRMLRCMSSQIAAQRWRSAECGGACPHSGGGVCALTAEVHVLNATGACAQCGGSGHNLHLRCGASDAWHQRHLPYQRDRRRLSSDARG